jgi:hypothetical protein
MANPRNPRDVGKEIDREIPSPDVARRAAEDIEGHAHDAPLHDQVFGFDDEGPAPEVDDTPPGAIRGNVYIPGIAAQPEKNQPMRNVGDTDQGDRQPDGGRRR